MSGIKTSSVKRILNERSNSRKKAPVWVRLKTNRKVTNSPQSHKNWKNSTMF